ncbi:hypothetical protein F4813DRAFT_396685 [Daldinia decipiens]|uniref:uncharacterized protein n=1 Tax=Daldinia decipiens TaxID=326647 RepID=UPI0020C2492E|nr:uncharacterized protein F4813DRAFT_396685 [Daldinia decipiens]KAI1662002.1 hypothetical protein F4813DRAFT_396685 [Daldinia decipiens]
MSTKPANPVLAVTAPRPKKIQPRDIGLKILVTPAEGEDTDVDIVAVHGIGIHPKDAWVHTGTKKHWLKDPAMLPTKVPNARIMAYNYESYWFGDDAIRQSVPAVASKLLKALCDARTHCPHRPIIFVGHCFGGLVIQQVYTAATFHHEDYPGIADSVTGIVFLGTPHHGVRNESELQTQGQIYDLIVISTTQIQDNALKTMAQDNDMLVSIVHDFTRKVSANENGPKLYCFYESKASKVGSITCMVSGAPPEFVVSESSATLTGILKESLSLDHSGMNKFEDSSDDNYKSVSREIRIMAEGSKETMKKRNLRAMSIESALSGPKPRMPSLPAPIAKETHFAPRGKILETIEERFRSTINVVLLGGSGNGKTHVAVEYAHKYFEEHPGCHVHWVNAASAAQFQHSYKCIAETLRLAKETMTDAEIVEEVHNALKKDVSGHWLMILDGLDDECLLNPTGSSGLGKSPLGLVPSSNYARVLITTRSNLLAKKMVKNKGQYIVDISRLNDDDASYVLLGKRTTDEARRKDSIEVSKTLGGSAGTLVLAYLYRKIREKEDGTGWKAYKSKLRALSSDGVGSSLMCSWRLLFDMIQERHPEDARLLLLMGTLNVQSVPSVFFERSELFKQIPRLVDYGMVEPSTNQVHFTVTPIIRQCIQTWLDQSGEKASVQVQTLSVLYEKFVDAKSSIFEALLPSTFAALEFQPAEAQGKLYLATLLLRVAEYLMERERPDYALEYLERGFSLSGDLKNKGGGLFEQTKAAIDKARGQIKSSKSKRPKGGSSDHDAAAAAAAARKELQELEKRVGKDHPDALRAANDFASSRLANGESRDSEEMVAIYKRALDWSVKTYGEDSIDSARHLYNLALAHDDRHEYEKAAALYHQASQVSERHLGPGNPELLKVLTNLALIYCKQGNLETAQQAFEVVLTGQRNALGLDHPETLMTRQNVALMLEGMGRVEEAGTEIQNVLDAQVRLLGGDDPATLQTACRLAANYKLQGLLGDAEKLLRATRKVQEKVLGKTHRDTVMTSRMLEELREETKGTRRRSTPAALSAPPAVLAV